MCQIKAGGGFSAWKGGIAWNAVKGIGIEKKGVETKISKGVGKLG